MGGKNIVEMDVENAFNTASRAAIEEQLEKELPSLLGYFRACYPN
jgi:hypothetical protein